MNHTALHEVHKSYGARMIDFAGWNLPLQFEGIKQEHMAVRRFCGLFDVSHMGEIDISGADAENLCEMLNTNDIAGLADGRARYGFFCYPDGGVVDDLITYKFSSERFLVCANASNTNKMLRWITDNSAGFEVKVRDVSSFYSQIAVQGPNSVALVKKTVGGNIMRDFPRFSFKILEGEETGVIAARTGYTGEDGFELFVPSTDAEILWKKLYENGRDLGTRLCGLGVRDTLRIEAGYPLYGNEIDERTTPIDAGLGRYVKIDKGEFIGRRALSERMESDEVKKTVGFRMVDRGIPRSGYAVMKNGKKTGKVTSGTMSPVLGEGVGMASVPATAVQYGDEIEIDIRGSMRKAVCCRFPIHKNLRN